MRVSNTSFCLSLGVKVDNQARKSAREGSEVSKKGEKIIPGKCKSILLGRNEQELVVRTSLGSIMARGVSDEFDVAIDVCQDA